jgi:hypothetical protein
MIEKVRLFSKKQLNGLIEIEDFFQFYPEDVGISEEIPISERNYPLILEIRVDHEEEYIRFGVPRGIGILNRIIDEFAELITVVLKYFIWGYEFIETIQEFSDQTSRDLPKEGEPQYFQSLRRDDRTVDEILVPKYWKRVIENYYGLEDEERFVIRKALRLFYDGVKLEVEYPSFSFVSMVSAIETLISYYCKDYKVERCKHCQQEQFKVMKKFKYFIQEFSGKQGKSFPKYLDKLYGKRSSIVHGGMLLFSDERSLTGEREIDPKRDDYWHRNDMTKITRAVLINWIASEDKLYTQKTTNSQDSTE